MKTKLYNLFLVILIILFCVVGSFVYKDFKKMYDSKKIYDEINEQCVSKKSTQNTDKIIDWDKLYKINSDIVAWIEIPNTPIDYPVLKSKDYNYYLSHDIHKKYSQYGSIFIDNRLYDNPFESKNLILYGHNMGHWTDVMFGTLMKYKEKKYLDKHKYIYLYTKKRKEKYQIVSIREVPSVSDAYDIDFTQEEFDTWLNNAVTKSIFHCSNDVKKVRQVLTLSTCTYGTNRLVVHCILSKED